MNNIPNIINIFNISLIVFIAFIFKRPNTDRTVLIYTTHIDDDNQHKRVKQLSQTFGNDVIVVWDNKHLLNCPFRGVACVDHIPISRVPTKYDMPHAGHGNEKAVTWAINNRATFKRVWFIEEDVHYTHVSVLKDIVRFNYTQDLLIQGRPYDPNPTKHKVHAVIMEEWRAFDNKVKPKTFLMNFWSATPRMLNGLEQIYIRNNNTWMNLEGLMPTTADYFNLTIGSWPEYFQYLNIKMQFRPCVTEFPKSGIYHPVKHRRGRVTACKFHKKMKKLPVPTFLQGYHNISINKTREIHTKLNKLMDKFKVEVNTALLNLNGIEKTKIMTLLSKNANTICEIGFNAGHSAITFLNGNSNASIISFDLRIKKYSTQAEHFLKSQFVGNRLLIIEGSSHQTLRRFHNQSPSVKCDIFLVDGDHSHEGVIKDLTDIYPMLHSHAVILLSDTNCPKHWCVDKARDYVVKTGLYSNEYNIKGMTVMKLNHKRREKNMHFISRKSTIP